MPAFLDLPAELRIQIYSVVFHDAIETSSLITLDKERSLILSCKQIYPEFEHEWCRAVNTIIAMLIPNTVLRPQAIYSFRCITNLHVYMSKDIGRKSLTPLVLPQLVQCARRLTLYADRPAFTNTLFGMFRSTAYLTLRHAQLSMKQDTKVVCLLDPWIPALHCEYKHAGPSQKSKNFRSRDAALALVIDHQLARETTVVELGKYEGTLLAAKGVLRHLCERSIPKVSRISIESQPALSSLPHFGDQPTCRLSVSCAGDVSSEFRVQILRATATFQSGSVGELCAIISF